VLEALKDAGIRFKDVQVAYFGQVYYEDMSMGESVLSALGLTTIPIMNVDNACSSGSSALWQAFWCVGVGMFDVALVIGAERVPRGPVAVTGGSSPERLLGSDHMMAAYALSMRRYMHDYNAPVTAIAQVAVKAKQNAALNPYAQFQKPVTLEEVLSSRMIAEPLTLFQCCPTSEGAAAAVICAREVVDRYVEDPGRVVSIRGAVLRTGGYEGDEGGENGSVTTTIAARQAYEMAGLGPKDMDIIQVHDAATIGEITQLEGLEIVPKGEGWRAEWDGRTALGGNIPVNTDGGLQAMGHPFGATGLRQVHELVTQLRSEAGPRQLKKARVGIAQNAGAGDVCTVHILEK
ncbi:MAG: thiolase family protein, partial [Dehalococcoidia bacterium]